MTHFLQFGHAAGDLTAVDVFVGGTVSERVGTGRLVLKGPFCQRSRMLPASFVLEPAADGRWTATVVDPCYWTPSLPACYRLHVVDAAGRTLSELCEVGLRRLEARESQLCMDGRRWVFRGVGHTSVPAGAWTEYGDALLGLAVATIDDQLGSAASRSGVPLLMRSSSADLPKELGRWAQWPAVQIVAMPATWGGTRQQLAAVAPNVLLAADVTATASNAIPAWADAVLCRAERAQLEAVCCQSPARPVLACQIEQAGVLRGERHALAMRSACEHLQRDLAPQFDLSGYIVG